MNYSCCSKYLFTSKLWISKKQPVLIIEKINLNQRKQKWLKMSKWNIWRVNGKECKHKIKWQFINLSIILTTTLNFNFSEQNVLLTKIPKNHKKICSCLIVDLIK